ncbi:MAG: AhpC/TSA family protein [Acidobacteriota bacterium]
MARNRAALEAAGTQVAFVHMSSPAVADEWFAKYGVDDLTRLSDPDKHLYRAFGLEQGTLRELAHPRVWWPWFRTALAAGFGAGLQGSDWKQLTGVFLIHDGRILLARRHRNSAVRPDYLALVASAAPGWTGERPGGAEANQA